MVEHVFIYGRFEYTKELKLTMYLVYHYGSNYGNANLVSFLTGILKSFHPHWECVLLCTSHKYAHQFATKYKFTYLVLTSRMWFSRKNTRLEIPWNLDTFKLTLIGVIRIGCFVNFKIMARISQWIRECQLVAKL